MNYKVLMISIVISLAAGALIERKFAAAPETKTEIREIIKDRIVTVTKIVTAADGTKTEDSTSTEDTTKVVDAVKTEKAPLAKYMLGAGSDFNGLYGIEVKYRLVGQVWVGASYNTNKEVLATVTVAF